MKSRSSIQLSGPVVAEMELRQKCDLLVLAKSRDPKSKNVSVLFSPGVKVQNMKILPVQPYIPDWTHIISNC